MVKNEQRKKFVNLANRHECFRMVVIKFRLGLIILIGGAAEVKLL